MRGRLVIEPDYDKREGAFGNDYFFHNKNSCGTQRSTNPILTVADAFYIVTKNSSFDRNENFGI